MVILFHLSGEDIALSAREVIHLFHLKRYFLQGNFLAADVSPRKAGLAHRLAYCRGVYSFLFSCPLSKLAAAFSTFSWNKACTGTFCVRVFRCSAPDGRLAPSEKELAGYIWRKLENPEVDLKHPDALIVAFIHGHKAFCGKLLFSIDRTFSGRNPHQRPEGHPTSLKPALARCLVNLSGIHKGSVTDIFCGSGGILIEAGLMGLPVNGYDLYSVMVEKARKNLLHYGITTFSLLQQDALETKDTIYYLVTDVPYGLNSTVWVNQGDKPVKLSASFPAPGGRIVLLRDFYRRLLIHLKKSLNGVAVIMFPSQAHAATLLSESGFFVVWKHTQRVHGSLSRDIFVFTLKKNAAKQFRTKRQYNLRRTTAHSRPETSGSRIR
ncbi:hypothetical protein HYU13_04890 [Candidatus Woesearchaeota archaeon]|nr:hypothetical protein [Candidatus Woesearchaeota archaeon]